MLTHPAAKEYAHALLELATERNEIDAVEDQIAGCCASLS